MPQRPDESDDTYERRVRIENMETDTAKKLHDIELSTKQFDLEQRRFFATKAFQDAERTLRYVCEAPVRLEARLGAWARALEAALPGN